MEYAAAELTAALELLRLDSSLITCLAVLETHGLLVAGSQAGEDLLVLSPEDGQWRELGRIELDVIPRDLLVGPGSELLLVAAGDDLLIELDIAALSAGEAVRPRFRGGMPGVPLVLAAGGSSTLLLGHGEPWANRLCICSELTHRVHGLHRPCVS